VLIPQVLQRYMGNLKVLTKPVQPFFIDSSRILKHIRKNDIANKFYG